ncbi:hypothetical protein CU633_19220 [Bacillus sp. V3-13]|uniref:hypothetical protein n=1 Tax=Bacillus sp. V3-13 TaxID=2053728 RepID=UPI000C7788CC|nr:hypothetical protein [Bacillus sp. V3-13]PLR75770.1 hypothetical protein CU633_19220 [Bacillus sp. V3-13]
MKNLKQWLLVLMASFMLVGIATGCSNEESDTEGTETEENTNTEEGTEEGAEEGTEEEAETGTEEEPAEEEK